MAEILNAPSEKAGNSGVHDLPSLNDALGSLQGELERLRSAAEHIEESKQVALESVEAARQVGKAAVVLAGPAQALVERLEKVDFPSRLDKLDATVSTLQSGFQALQERLDGVERNVKDDVRSAQTAVADQIEAVGQAVSATQREIEGGMERRAAVQVEAVQNLGQSVESSLESVEKGVRDDVRELRSAQAETAERVDAVREAVAQAHQGAERHAAAQVKAVQSLRLLLLGVLLMLLVLMVVTLAP